jgi:hypothetical protein
MNPPYLNEFMNENGYPHDVGFHLRSSSSLKTIWDNPTNTNNPQPPAPYGKFTNALPIYEWNHVSLQPHPVSGATLGQDAEYIENFINLAQQNPANEDTIFWLYSTWPTANVNYQSYWTQSSIDNPATSTTRSRAYMKNLIEHVRDQLPGVDIRMLPVGEVWYELDIRMRAGLVPGFTNVDELYRDNIHANQIGKYVAGMTFMAAFIENVNIELVEDTYYNYTNRDPGLVPAFLDAIHDIVFTHPYTGISLSTPVGDYDRNGTVGAEDYDYWQVHYGTTVAQLGAGADGNFDGKISAADYTVWRDNYDGEPLGLASYSIPEPMNVGSCMLALGLLLIFRRKVKNPCEN